MSAPVETPFAIAAPTLLASGYSPLPIAPGTKAPGQFGENGWHAMRGWSRYCAEPASPNKVRSWSHYPEAGVGIALGRGVIAIDIDRDELVEPLLAVLPAVVVAKRGRKGLTVFYRADTTKILSRNFAGFLDILGHGKQTVLPPSIHPEAAEPYVWTTPRSLADTRPEDLSLYTTDHDAALLDVLHAHGWARDERKAAVAPAREPRPREAREAGSGDLHDLNALALGDLDRWVPSLGLKVIEREGNGYRAVAEWRPSASGRPLAARKRNLSIHPKGIVDFGTGRGFSALDLVMRARRLDFVEAVRWLAERLNFALPDVSPTAVIHAHQGESAPAVVATYPDRRLPLKDAEAALKIALESAFAAFEKHHADYAVYVERRKTNVLALPPAIPAILVNSEMGLGKSLLALIVILAFLRKAPPGTSLVYAVARIDLAEKTVEDLAERGFHGAKVYLGRDRPDPENTSEKMCLNGAAVQDALRAGANVYESVCERKRKGAQPIRCPFFERCGYLRQQKATPQIWVIPSNRLFQVPPSVIPRPYALIVDEKFHDGATSSAPSVLTLDEIEKAPLPRIPEDRAFVDDARRKLLAAFRSLPDGHVDRQALLDTGMTAKEARDAGKAERRRWRDAGLDPSLSPRERKRRVDEAVAANKNVRELSGLFREVALFLDGDEPISGRITLGFDDKKKARVACRTRLRQVNRPDVVDGKWSVPTLLLDGTAPPAEVLSIALGLDVEVRADVTALWSDQGYVSQIIGAPVARKGLGLGAEPIKRSLKYYRRHILRRASTAWPRKVAVVAQEEVKKKLESLGLPNNVETGHFNALAGLNKWAGEDVECLIAIGRILPAPHDMETEAATLTGRPSLPCQPSREGGNPFYDEIAGGIRMRDGSVVATRKTYRHPDPVTEVFRRGACEAELLQAIYRIRPHRREQPFFVDIFSDQPLPLIVDEVKEWKDAIPPAYWDMAAEGVLLSSPADVARAFPELALTEKSARRVSYEIGTSALFPIETLYSKKGGSHFSYETPGRQPATGLLLPNWPAPTLSNDRLEWTLIRWLERRLETRVRWVEIDGKRVVRHAALLAAVHEATRPVLPLTRFPEWRRLPLPVIATPLTSAIALVTGVGHTARVPNGASLPERLAEIIRRRGGASARNLRNAVRPQPSAEELRAALDDLIKAGRVEVETAPERPTGGRPSIRYVAIGSDTEAA